MKKCCEKMESFIDQKCENNNIFECPDNIIIYEEKFDEYGIIIHDGGKSYVRIKYCPWCGKELPISRREQWFEELHKQGFENPFEEEIPKEFENDVWWRKME